MSQQLTLAHGQPPPNPNCCTGDPNDYCANCQAAVRQTMNQAAGLTVNAVRPWEHDGNDGDFLPPTPKAVTENARGLRHPSSRSDTLIAPNNMALIVNDARQRLAGRNVVVDDGDLLIPPST